VNSSIVSSNSNSGDGSGSSSVIEKHPTAKSPPSPIFIDGIATPPVLGAGTPPLNSMMSMW
jgi:hypothetical protein